MEFLKLLIMVLVIVKISVTIRVRDIEMVTKHARCPWAGLRLGLGAVIQPRVWQPTCPATIGFAGMRCVIGRLLYGLNERDQPPRLSLQIGAIG